MAAVMLETIAVAIMLCALAPAVLFVVNLRRYRVPPLPGGSQRMPAISVLIPARNEEHAIRAAVESVLGSRGVGFEVIVMDDASTDRTAEIVSALTAADPRVRPASAPPLPPGWNGKQHACWALARVASHPTLCFMDADVRLAPEALERMAAFLERSDASLVSGFPRQITRSPLEWTLLPLIHFVLLGFLPMSKMRAGTDPSYAAGCGQFLMARRESYFAAGGHAGIRETRHDGLRLPKLLRQHGFHTDLADLTPLATCRMYTNAREVWTGLAKNATEGIGAPVRILPISILLLTGQVAPFLLLPSLLLAQSPVKPEIWTFAAVACVAAILPRLLACRRFSQPLRSAAVHPFAILLLLAIQWYALARKLTGGAITWKDRAYAGE